MMASGKVRLAGMTRDEIRDWAEGLGEPSYRGLQIFQWIHGRGARDFGAMTDLPLDLRRRLDGLAHIGFAEIDGTWTSGDGTRKMLIALGDGWSVETVLIPEGRRRTLCISSQVGCAMGCAFCLTGRGGFVRNLEPSEIVNQVCAVRADLSSPGAITNIVFMGMGEPLANYQNVVQAVRTISGQNGLQFSSRRVTLSTAGLVPRIDDLGRNVTVNLAVSLNAADNDTRDKLMPVNRTYPIEALLSSCKRFPLPSRRMITFEYVLIAGLNDRPRDAERLARLLRPLRAKINLIPFNAYEGCEFERPDPETIAAFHKLLLDRHYTAIIRDSKGADDPFTDE